MKKLVVFLSIIICLNTNAQVCFNTAVNYAPYYPKPAGSATSADFNGDSIPDLAVADGGIMVLFGLGNGNFGSPVNLDFEPDGGADFITNADFDGDGNIDLAVVGSPHANAMIIWGDGAGGFPDYSTFAAGTNPDFRSIVTADFNRDGIPDMAIGDVSSVNVFVFLGVGGGRRAGSFWGPSLSAFGAPVSFASVGQPYSIICADLNGDGIADLATADYVFNQVSVLLGTGTGTFGAFTSFFVGSVPNSITCADFNGDGKLDLATTNLQSRDVSVLLGNGSGSFGTETRFAVAGSSSNPYSITSTDFNGDGKIDLAAAVQQYASNGAAYILLGNGTGSFGAAGSFAAGIDPVSVMSADFNGDGKADLAVGNKSSNYESVLINCSAFCTGSFGSAVNFAAGTSPRSVTKADFNGDGKVDLAVANQSSNDVAVFLGTGNGSFGAAVNFSTGITPYSVISADFNRDGIADLAVANAGSNNVSILLGTGSGSFGAAANFAVGTNPYSVTSADFNGDDKLDLAVTNYNSNTMSILLGSGNGSFGAAANFAVGTNPYSVTSADFNRDGKADLAVTNWSSNNVSILLNTGGGTFGAASNFAAGTNPCSITITDLNRDGKPDLTIANAYSANVSVLLGTGAGSFAAAVNYAAGANPVSVTIADFNGDGKADIAAANWGSGNVSLLLGTGSGSFGAASNFSAGNLPASITSADFNGDGKPDLAVANNASNNVSILLLNTPGAPTGTAAQSFCSGASPTVADLTAAGGSPIKWYIAADGGTALPSNTALVNNSHYYASQTINSCGGESTARFDATAAVNITPAITSSSDLTANTALGLCSAVVTYGAPAVIGYPAPAVTYSFSGATAGSGTGTGSGAAFNNGITTVTLTAANSCGTPNCSFTITISDNINPSITAPAAITVNTNTGCTAAEVSLGTPETADNCTIASVVNDAPEAFPIGNTTVTWTVTDGSGNTAAAVQTVTVTDNVNPVITSPGDITVNTNTGNTATGVNLGTAITADNCTVASITNDAPSAFPIGNTTVTWTAADGSGNTAAATQTVTVTDNINPVITAPAAVTVNTNSGCTAIGVNIGTAATSDNAAVASLTNDHPSTAYPLGNTTVTWTVTDGSGNTSVAAQTVTVTDDINPSITAPADIILNTNTGCTAAGVGLGTPEAEDNCTVANITNDHPSTTYSLGNTNVIWTVTDGSGNTATAVQTVTVADNVNPTINAPASVTVNTNTGCTASGVNIGTAATADNCSVVSVTNDAPAVFQLGNTTVTWTVTDGSGNTKTASQTVIVSDTVKPTITAPADVTSCNAAAITLGTPNTADNCSVANVNNNAPAAYPLGTTTVIWTVADGSGNTASSSQTITVSSSPDMTTAVSGVSITANQAGAVYKWLNCNTGYSIIAGATNQTYTAAVNGTYAVLVKIGNCSDTSACVSISNVGINESDLKAQFIIYPNPFTWQTTISFSEEQKNTTIKIMDVLGKEVKTINVTGKQLTIEKGDMQSGIYFVQLIDGSKSAVIKKIVIE